MEFNSTNTKLYELYWDSSEFGFKCGMLKLVPIENKAIDWKHEIKNVIIPQHNFP